MTTENVIENVLKNVMYDIAYIMGRDAFIECANDSVCLEKLTHVCLENMFYEIYNLVLEGLI